MQNNKSIIIIVIIILVIVIALAAAWYFYFRTPPTPYAPATTPEQKQQSAQPGSNTPSADNNTLSAGDTIVDITKDLDKTSDESAVNNELNSLDRNLQNF